MKLQCENKFCIYFKSNCCTLDYISLDDVGMCLECILVEIEEEILEAKRNKIIAKYKV